MLGKKSRAWRTSFLWDGFLTGGMLFSGSVNDKQMSNWLELEKIDLCSEKNHGHHPNILSHTHRECTQFLGNAKGSRCLVA